MQAERTRADVCLSSVYWQICSTVSLVGAAFSFPGNTTPTLCNFSHGTDKQVENMKNGGSREAGAKLVRQHHLSLVPDLGRRQGPFTHSPSGNVSLPLAFPLNLCQNCLLQDSQQQPVPADPMRQSSFPDFQFLEHESICSIVWINTGNTPRTT